MNVSAEDIRKILTDVVELFLVPKFNELGMNASGEWLDNLEVTSQVNKGEILGRDYSVQLALGRMPGTMPPIEPIEKWANIKLGLYGTQARSAAFAIAKTMQQKGTTWYQKGGTDLISILSSPEVIKYIHNRVSIVVAVNVQNRIQDLAKEIFT